MAQAAAGLRIFVSEPEALPRLKSVISREAGGPDRVMMREFRGVAVRGELTVTLTPSASAALAEPVLSAVEVVAEGW